MKKTYKIFYLILLIFLSTIMAACSDAEITSASGSGSGSGSNDDTIYDNPPLSPPSWTHGTWYDWSSLQSFTFLSNDIYLKNGLVGPNSNSQNSVTTSKVSQISDETASPKNYTFTYSRSGRILQSLVFEEDAPNGRINVWVVVDPTWSEGNQPSIDSIKSNYRYLKLAKNVSSTVTPPSWLYGKWTNEYELFPVTFKADDILLPLYEEYGSDILTSIKYAQGFTQAIDNNSPKNYILFQNTYGQIGGHLKFEEIRGNPNKINVYFDTYKDSASEFVPNDLDAIEYFKY